MNTSAECLRDKWPHLEKYNHNWTGGSIRILNNDCNNMYHRRQPSGSFDELGNIFGVLPGLTKSPVHPWGCETQGSTGSQGSGKGEDVPGKYRNCSGLTFFVFLATGDICGPLGPPSEARGSFPRNSQVLLCPWIRHCSTTHANKSHKQKSLITVEMGWEWGRFHEMTFWECPPASKFPLIVCEGGGSVEVQNQALVSGRVTFLGNAIKRETFSSEDGSETSELYRKDRT